ncbi:MAG TPA: hypothetical protein VFK85_14170 [Anaeromyxobacteraceae bacterium]|nr:hypothetical protein [Anaeromyxobacteraceae bacterium]
MPTASERARRERRPSGVNLPAAGLALAAAAVLLVLIYVGSRGLRDFDSALVGYAVATVFALAAIVYRYALWITRPPTWRYFVGGWRNFLSAAQFRRYASLVPIELWRDIFGQTFLRHRSRSRWIMHLCLFYGVLLSLAVTLPLTFGWIRFTLVPPEHYQLWVFGLPVVKFGIHAGIGFGLFHALDFTAALLIVGVAIALWRRFTDVGLLTTQRFGFDLVPLVLLFAIAVTGVALTASTMWWEGRFYSFIALVHEAVVVGWLVSLPFGKFFHLAQRPASVGVTLYQRVSQGLPEAGGAAAGSLACRRCGAPLPSAQFVSDLKGTLADLGQSYDLGGGRGALHDYCPTCKRKLRSSAYYQLLGKRFV